MFNHEQCLQVIIAPGPDQTPIYYQRSKSKDDTHGAGGAILEHVLLVELKLLSVTTTFICFKAGLLGRLVLFRQLRRGERIMTLDDEERVDLCSYICTVGVVSGIGDGRVCL